MTDRVLSRLNGKRFKKATMEKTPEYYLLYFSASWWPPCVKAAPQLVEKYNSQIADTPNVEFVHVSLDQNDDAAEGWAEKEKFPWLTILPDDAEKSGLKEYKTTNSVPEYHLVDAEGNTIVAGSAGNAAAFQKIKEIAEAKPEAKY